MIELKGQFLPADTTIQGRINVVTVTVETKEVPSPTPEDNGKFLQVVNGVWAAVDAVPQVVAIVNAVIEEALGGDY